MSYFKLVEIVKNWDEIHPEYDAQPKVKPIQSDDHDELVDKFFNSIFGEEESFEGDQEDFNSDETSENSRSYWDESLDHDN